MKPNAPDFVEVAWCGGGGGGGVGCGGDGVVRVVLAVGEWWRLRSGDKGESVAARVIVDPVDRATRIVFGFGRKARRKSFPATENGGSGGGDQRRLVVTNGGWWLPELMGRVCVFHFNKMK
uniref:Uncharacterized protein n=1 Tax=Tanacetum cinerariifolium TaxID=118510 RepID=A0A699H4X0_TANCI|nr:hypothetical protein [Tanacetum cinerariifolium]